MLGFVTNSGSGELDALVSLGCEGRADLEAAYYLTVGRQKFGN
jgi:hypothetical protein